MIGGDLCPSLSLFLLCTFLAPLNRLHDAGFGHWIHADKQIKASRKTTAIATVTRYQFI